MREFSKVDLGSIKIHKQVLIDIITSAVQDVPGVSLVTKDWTAHVADLIGVKRVPGIGISIEKNGQVTVDVKVLVRYGLNIQDAARQTDEAVRSAIRKTVDIDLKDVNVNIVGIERGDQ